MLSTKRVLSFAINIVVLATILQRVAHAEGFECVMEIEAPRYTVLARWMNLEGEVTVTGMLDQVGKIESLKMAVDNPAYTKSDVLVLTTPVNLVIEKAKFKS